MSPRPTRHLIDRALQRLIGKMRALFTCNNDILPIVGVVSFLKAPLSSHTQAASIMEVPLVAHIDLF